MWWCFGGFLEVLKVREFRGRCFGWRVDYRNWLGKW